MGWTISEHGRNLHRIEFDLSVKNDFHILLMSDVHWDSPYCDRDLLKRHLDEAKEIGAPVLDCGDFFDVMQGKYDPRSDKGDLRPELLEDPNEAYLDACVRQAAEFLDPYKDILTVRGLGNHETAMRKRHEHDMTGRFVERLRQAGSKTAHLGGYGGYVVLQATVRSHNRIPLDLYYFHGAGAGRAAVTRGVIGTNRRAASVDADILWTGHIHEQWVVWMRRLTRRQSMQIKQTDQAHVCTPGYKNEYEDGHSGFHVETGKPPKPLGAYWLRLYVRYKNGPSGSGKPELKFDFREAK